MLDVLASCDVKFNAILYQYDQFVSPSVKACNVTRLSSNGLKDIPSELLANRGAKYSLQCIANNREMNAPGR